MGRGKMDSDDFQMPESTDRMIDPETLSTGQSVILAEKMPDTKYADLLNFFQEPVTFVVHEGDQNDENPVRVGVNGNYRQFYRGQQYTVPRCFVDALITKKSNITTPEVSSPTGERMRVMRATHQLRYPFQVINDPSPVEGAKWLQRRMADAV